MTVATLQYALPPVAWGIGAGISAAINRFGSAALNFAKFAPLGVGNVLGLTVLFYQATADLVKMLTDKINKRGWTIVARAVQFTLCVGAAAGIVIGLSMVMSQLWITVTLLALTILHIAIRWAIDHKQSCKALCEASARTGDSPASV